MPHLKKDEVRKAIIKQIEELCSENKISYTGKTEIKLADKSFCFKEVKHPTIQLYKDFYAVGENITFEGYGDFVFIECDESLPVHERGRFCSRDYKFTGTACLKMVSNLDCYICINNNSLSIISIIK